MPAPRVLVVGAGATGSCCALRLRQALGRDAKIEVWEKARGPGGRMSTNRQELGGTTVRADMGAQYLSMDSNDPASASVAELLQRAGVCAEVPAAVLSATPERPSRDGWLHLAGTGGGVNDALKKLLEESGAEVHYEKRIASLDEQQGRWRARPFDGAPGLFDAVVLAVPGCGVGGDNLNKIRGSYEGRFTPEQNRQLLAVQHDARWAFGLFFSLDCLPKVDAFFGPDAVEKVVDQGGLHLLCHQSRKTALLSGAAPTGAVAVVAHTTIDWAKRNARAGGRDERLLREVAEQVQGLLGLDRASLVASKVITWKQCQVTRAAPASRPHGPCMLAGESPALALAGDYFADSSFGGCLRSAAAAAEAVAGALAAAPRADKASEKEAEGAAEPSARGAEGGKGGGGKGKTSSAAQGQADGYGNKGKEGKGKGKSKGGKGKSAYPEKQWEEEEWRPSGGKGKGGKKGYAWRPYSGA